MVFETVKMNLSRVLGINYILLLCNVDSRRAGGRCLLGSRQAPIDGAGHGAITYMVWWRCDLTTRNLLILNNFELWRKLKK